MATQLLKFKGKHIEVMQGLAMGKRM